MSVGGLSTEQKEYLVQIKANVELVLCKLQALKRIGFDSLKDVDQLARAIEDKKIDLTYIPHLNTPITINLDRKAGQPVRLSLHLVPKLQ